jgi:hypothetical protein
VASSKIVFTRMKCVWPVTGLSVCGGQGRGAGGTRQGWTDNWDADLDKLHSEKMKKRFSVQGKIVRIGQWKSARGGFHEGRARGEALGIPLETMVVTVIISRDSICLGNKLAKWRGDETGSFSSLIQSVSCHQKITRYGN